MQKQAEKLSVATQEHACLQSCSDTFTEESEILSKYKPLPAAVKKK